MLWRAGGGHARGVRFQGKGDLEDAEEKKLGGLAEPNHRDGQGN